MSTKYLERGDYRRNQNRIKAMLLITCIAFGGMLAAQSVNYKAVESKLVIAKQALKNESFLYSECITVVEHQDNIINMLELKK
jgi:hypothetical protein